MSIFARTSSIQRCLRTYFMYKKTRTTTTAMKEKKTLSKHHRNGREMANSYSCNHSLKYNDEDQHIVVFEEHCVKSMNRRSELLVKLEDSSKTTTRKKRNLSREFNEKKKRNKRRDDVVDDDDGALSEHNACWY